MTMEIKYGWIWIAAMSVVILVGDFISGREINFAMFYILPVSLAAWIKYPRAAYLLAVALPVARVLFFIPWESPYFLQAGIVNAFIRGLILLLMAFITNRARGVIELQRQVKILRGMLPICASCKRVRNSQGEYEQIEAFIKDRSEAEFSHGICPDCMKKLYPEYTE